jgi:hypothetical protein
MDSFISDVQRIRESFGDTPSGADGHAVPPARSDGDAEMAQPVPGAYSVEPTPRPEEYEHKGIWCDYCSQKVFGIRHKCLDCYNFDLVSHLNCHRLLWYLLRNCLLVQPLHDYQGYPDHPCRHATYV